jgi:FdhD protein
LCGIESIAEAIRPAAVIGSGRKFSPEQIMVAMQSLPSRQKLNIETRAVHAAAFWNTTGGIVALREDVGRHNALDKLSGALARASVVASDGIILLTSRVSVEMVQKNASIGGARYRVGLGPDRAGCSYGGRGGYYACRHRAR